MCDSVCLRFFFFFFFFFFQWGDIFPGTIREIWVEHSDQVIRERPPGEPGHRNIGRGRAFFPSRPGSPPGSQMEWRLNARPHNRCSE